MPDDIKIPETASKSSKGTSYADIIKMREANEAEKTAISIEEEDTAIEPGYTKVHRRIGPRRRRR